LHAVRWITPPDGEGLRFLSCNDLAREDHGDTGGWEGHGDTGGWEGHGDTADTSVGHSGP
jgi:hypothetical protein